MSHADSPTVVADSAEFKATHTLAEAESHGHTVTEDEYRALKANWRCPHDGQMNNGTRCTTCGTAK